MKYAVYLSPVARRQYDKLDTHVRSRIRKELLKLETEPYHKGERLQGIRQGLLYSKIFHSGVQYRAVYDVSDSEKEVLIIFLGTRENFYKELRRYLRK